jgi:hypothetical protein
MANPVIDTGEMLNAEMGFQAAQTYAREQEAKIERVADVLVRNARLMHKQLHPIIEGGMSKCRMVSCREVRAVLGLP